MSPKVDPALGEPRLLCEEAVHDAVGLQSTKYTAHGVAAFGCGQRRNNMTGAAVFAIVSIIVALVLVVWGLLMVLRVCQSFLLPLILSLVGTATLLVYWACVAGVYNNKMCGGYKGEEQWVEVRRWFYFDCGRLVLAGNQLRIYLPPDVHVIWFLGGVYIYFLF